MPIPSAPILYSFELTSACNNRCSGCGNVMSRDSASRALSAAQWRTVLTALKPYVHRLKLTGGEPTLHPEFTEIVLTLRELDIPFALFTNGRWQSPDRLTAFLGALSQCRGLLVSLHGATAAVHDAFTGVSGSFEETCANIQRAVAAGLMVTTSTVITRRNWDHVDAIAHLSQGLGADHAVFNRFLGEASSQVGPTPEQLHRAMETIDRARSLGQRVKFGNCIPQCFHPSSSTGCLAGVAYCTVDPEGNVRPCNHAPLICGNLLEQPIERLWHSSTMEQWRKLIPEQCSRCQDFSTCHGGCRAAALMQGVQEDPLIQSPVTDKTLDSPRELVLSREARPVGRYKLRPESFGYVLLRGNRLVPVAETANPVLDACNGETSLAQLQECFGQEALDFVGSLIRSELVELLPESPIV